jgi:dTMP kinase
MSGYFVTIEGPEGAGKSTQARRLATALRSAGRSVLVTREPGGTPLGEQIRALLLNRTDYAMLAETEALLHTAARSQHVGEVIRPALNSGQVVVCDRFVDSTLAYQGGGRGIAIERLLEIQELATRGLKPDLKILIDLPIHLGLNRRLEGRDEVNRMDTETEAFHQRVRETFLELARQRPEDWIVIDGSNDEALVTDDLLRAVAERTALFAAANVSDVSPNRPRSVADA